MRLLMVNMQEFLPFQHEIDSPSYFMGHDGHGLGLAIPLGQRVYPFLDLWDLSHHEDNGLPESPSQMSVPDFPPIGSQLIEVY